MKCKQIKTIRFILINSSLFILFRLPETVVTIIAFVRYEKKSQIFFDFQIFFRQKLFAEFDFLFCLYLIVQMYLFYAFNKNFQKSLLEITRKTQSKAVLTAVRNSMNALNMEKKEEIRRKSNIKRRSLVAFELQMKQNQIKRSNLTIKISRVNNFSNE